MGTILPGAVLMLTQGFVTLHSVSSDMSQLSDKEHYLRTLRVSYSMFLSVHFQT